MSEAELRTKLPFGWAVYYSRGFDAIFAHFLPWPFRMACLCTRVSERGLPSRQQLIATFYDERARMRGERRLRLALRRQLSEIMANG